MKQPVLNIEKRSENRLHLYRGEMSDITFSLNQNDYFVHAYDLSPDGIGVIVDENLEGIELDTSVNLRLPGAQTRLAGTITHKSYVQFGGKRCCKLGIQFDDLSREAPLRDKRRFSLVQAQQPIVQLYFEQPGNFGRFQYAQVVDLCRDGLAFAVDRRDPLALIRSMSLKGAIVLPSGGLVHVRFEVRYSRLHNSKRIYGCRLVEASSDFAVQMAEFLLNHADQPSLRQLEAEGFQPDSIAGALRFAYAGRKEFHEILDLRRAYSHSVGILLDQTDLADFYQDQDARSRQLYCELAGRVVGAARVSFPERTDLVSGESYQLIPAGIREKSFLELSQICFHHDFKSVDIILGILQHAIKIAVENQLAYVLIHSHDGFQDLLPSLGALSLGRYSIKNGSETVDCRLFLLETSATILGEGQRPEQWARFSKPLCDYLLEKQMIRPRLWDEVRLKSYQLILNSSQWWREQWQRFRN